VKRASDYAREATERCERVLVTVLGNVGPATGVRSPVLHVRRFCSHVLPRATLGGEPPWFPDVPCNDGRNDGDLTPGTNACIEHRAVACSNASVDPQVARSDASQTSRNSPPCGE